jgi:hypothetical protein
MGMTTTTKCEQCNAEIFPEEETTIIEDEFTAEDLLVCEKCAFRAWKRDRAKKRVLHQIIEDVAARAEEEEMEKLK